MITPIDRVERKCVRCGVIVLTTARNLIRCAHCREKMRKALQQKQYKRHVRGNAHLASLVRDLLGRKL